MITNNLEVFYMVYPSWAKFPWRWKKLDAIFRDPYGSGFLERSKNLERIGYHPGIEKYQLISGPVGNGIIKGIGNMKGYRCLWMPVLTKVVNFIPLPGFPDGGEPEYDNVKWMEEKNTDEHRLGLKTLFPTFLPKISFDYDECPDTHVYVSLAFRALSTGRVDDEICLRFQMRCRSFGWQCRPINHDDQIPSVVGRLVSPRVIHRWFIVERGDDDAGLLAAKMFYLACAAKQENQHLFQWLHVVGAFETKPAMAQSWCNRDGSLVY